MDGYFFRSLILSNVNILVSFDHHSNTIAAALGLEAVLPRENSGNKGSEINAIAVHWNHAGVT